jgi:hypothetical protein
MTEDQWRPSALEKQAPRHLALKGRISLPSDERPSRSQHVLSENVAMRTDHYLCESDLDDAWVNDADLVGFFHPREIVRDPLLTHGRKRQLLSYWLSDVHAVTGMPQLRAYQFGPPVTVDDLREALIELGEIIDAGAMRNDVRRRPSA